MKVVRIIPPNNSAEAGFYRYKGQTRGNAIGFCIPAFALDVRVFYQRQRKLEAR